MLVTKVDEDKYFTYDRIGHVPDHPTNGNQIWCLKCLGQWRGEYMSDGRHIYHHIGYEEYNGFVISAPTELDAIRIAVEAIEDNHAENNHWTIELVGATLQNYTKPIVLKSNTGA